MAMQKALVERFFRYVKIDTQSKEEVEDQYPSTEKQKELSRLLVDELKDMGIADAEMDEFGYVMATLPSNLPAEKTPQIPVIGFLAHVDTSPEISGRDVNPVLHENYSGGDIILSESSGLAIKADENPDLEECMGHDIITSDGSTLLGADDKAGVAEIMTMADVLLKNPTIPRGTIRIGFTPDEEVGAGTKYFDIEKFGAQYAYTVDSGRAGNVENETFNAATAVFRIKGVGVHPGYAKGKLVNATRIASEIIKELEDMPAPETTEKKEGYLHPYSMEGGSYEMTLKILIRDFEIEGLKEKSVFLEGLRERVAEKYPAGDIRLEINDSYMNMRYKLEEAPQVVDLAMESVRCAGIEPHLTSIRGGTDGASLSYRGLPTPNLFTGGHNFHSRFEWVSVQDMELAVNALVHLVELWAGNSLEKQ